MYIQNLDKFIRNTLEEKLKKCTNSKWSYSLKSWVTFLDLLFLLIYQTLKACYLGLEQHIEKILGSQGR